MFESTYSFFVASFSLIRFHQENFSMLCIGVIHNNGSYFILDWSRKKLYLTNNCCDVIIILNKEDEYEQI